MHEGVVARKIAAEGGKSDLIEKNNEIRRKNILLQSLAAQLKAIGEEIKQLANEIAREKGSAIHGRIADVLARRNRAIDRAGGMTLNRMKSKVMLYLRSYSLLQRFLL